MRGTHVERVVTDGDTLDVGALKIQVVGTPGHSADSVSYLAEINGKVLAFTGDSVDGQGVLGAIIVGPTLLQYEGSLRRLAECSPDGIMPGHGIPTLRNAREIITRAADKVATPWQGIDTSTRDYAPSWWLAHHPQTRQSPGLA
jgi:glyoxylase-like metal-dependent hydrolase (beta-lactamase superfamily II)